MTLLKIQSRIIRDCIGADIRKVGIGFIKNMQMVLCGDIVENYIRVAVTKNVLITGGK